MNGVESSTNTARMVRESSGFHGLLSAPGTDGAERGSADTIHQDAFVSAGTAVRNAPAGNGLTDLTGTHQQNFEVYLTPDPVEPRSTTSDPASSPIRRLGRGANSRATPGRRRKSGATCRRKARSSGSRRRPRSRGNTARSHGAPGLFCLAAPARGAAARQGAVETPGRA
jgi:hypothetical protein